MTKGPYFENDEDREEPITQAVRTDAGLIRININDLMRGIEQFNKLNGGGGKLQREKKTRTKSKSGRELIITDSCFSTNKN